jgi:hypothetical protein
MLIKVMYVSQNFTYMKYLKKGMYHVHQFRAVRLNFMPDPVAVRSKA